MWLIPIRLVLVSWVVLFFTIVFVWTSTVEGYTITIDILSTTVVPLPPGDPLQGETNARMTVDTPNGIVRLRTHMRTPFTLDSSESPTGSARFHPRWGGGNPVRYGYGSFINIGWVEGQTATFNMETGTLTYTSSPGDTSVHFLFKPISVTIENLDLSRNPLPLPNGVLNYDNIIQADALFSFTPGPHTFTGANLGAAKIRVRWGGGRLIDYGWGDVGTLVNWQGGETKLVHVPIPPPDPDRFERINDQPADEARVEFLFEEGDLTIDTVDISGTQIPGLIQASGPIGVTEIVNSPVTVHVASNGTSNFWAFFDSLDSGLVTLSWRKDQTRTRVLDPPSLEIDSTPGETVLQFAAHWYPESVEDEEDEEDEEDAGG